MKNEKEENGEVKKRSILDKLTRIIFFTVTSALIISFGTGALTGFFGGVAKMDRSMCEVSKDSYFSPNPAFSFPCNVIRRLFKGSLGSGGDIPAPKEKKGKFYSLEDIKRKTTERSYEEMLEMNKKAMMLSDWAEKTKIPELKESILEASSEKEREFLKKELSSILKVRMEEEVRIKFEKESDLTNPVSVRSILKSEIKYLKKKEKSALSLTEKDVVSELILLKRKQQKNNDLRIFNMK